MTKLTNITSPDDNTHKHIFPYNGEKVGKDRLSFSFSCFDRSHKLFNLGENASPDGVVSGKWFLDLFDCLKSVNKMPFEKLCKSMHDLHRIDWENTNASPPSDSQQQEYWQFRINKSRGRIIGLLIDNVFYVVWLDPHHNLTNSEGYGKAVRHHRPMSEYEQMCQEMERLRDELKTYQELFDNISS